MKSVNFQVRILVIGSSLWVSSMGLTQAEAPNRQGQLEAIETSWKDNAQEIFPLDTLEHYVKAGMDRSPNLKAAFYEWKAAVAKVSKEFSLPDPQFSYTEYIEEVETRVGPQQRAFSIRQMFPFPDKLWIRRSRAFQMSEAAYQRFEGARLELINNISEAYYEFAFLSKAVLISQENLKLLKNFESVAQSKYASGLTKNQDLLKIQVELGRQENDLRSLEDMRNPLMMRIRSLLHLPTDTELPRPVEALEDLRFDDRYQNLGDLITDLTANNPRLRAMSAAVAAKNEELRLARREYAPDFAIGVTQIQTGDALNPSTMDSGKDALTVMLSVNVPLWFDRINAGINDAKAELTAAQFQRQGAEDELLSKLSMAQYKLRDAWRQSRLYKDALIPKAVQTLNATKSAYESGGMDFLSLIDAQRTLLNFQLSFYRYNADFHQRLVEVQSLVGAIQSDFTNQGDEQ